MSINYDTLNPKYANNTRLWLRDLQAHRAYLKELILGEEGEWRRELEWILSCTDETLMAVRDKLVEEDFLVDNKTKETNGSR